MSVRSMVAQSKGIRVHLVVLDLPQILTTEKPGRAIHQHPNANWRSRQLALAAVTKHLAFARKIHVSDQTSPRRHDRGHLGKARPR
jgi:hypothetical protein